MTCAPLFTYDPDLLQQFREAPSEKQVAVGDPPKSWAAEMGVKHEYDLPDEPLTRQQVRRICRDSEKDPLYGYLCVMAWGAQGRGLAGSRPVKAAWRARETIEASIERLRGDGLTRADAYDLFAGDGKVPGLGPAYFTKLLYFYSPADPPDCYIMDQWTTKPVILLTEKNIIRHSSIGPTDLNTGKNYELFCRVIDDLATRFKVPGETMEEMLFSVGSIRRGPRGAWRQIVVDAWEERAVPRYKDSEVGRLLQDSRQHECEQM